MPMTTITRSSAEMAVNVSAREDENNSAVVGLPDGGYVVVWKSAADVFETMSARRCDAAGNSVGEFIINDFTAHSGLIREESTPFMPVASDGGDIISWAATNRFVVDRRRPVICSGQCGVRPSGDGATDVSILVNTTAFAAGDFIV